MTTPAVTSCLALCRSDVLHSPQVLQDPVQASGSGAGVAHRASIPHGSAGVTGREIATRVALGADGGGLANSLCQGGAGRIGRSGATWTATHD
jgi:hypothetical protein